MVVVLFLLFYYYCNMVLILLKPVSVLSDSIDCTRNNCVQLADPLIKQPHLIFPDNLQDIDLVCTMWNRLVDCLKTYTDVCFTETQRKQFNKAVENPIESVHQMCQQPTYQKEYLQHASCIKKMITEQSHCGGHYNVLVDQVAQRDIISKSTLCCSNARFRQCVYQETLLTCDQNQSNGPASIFSTQILDKALSFLHQQCSDFVSGGSTEDCSTIIIGGQNPQIILDPLTISWGDDDKDDDIIRIRPKQHKFLSTLSPSTTMEHKGVGGRFPYGRASSWEPLEGRTTSTNWQYPSPSSSPPNSGGTNFFTSTTGKSTETWYPAAGNQFDNEVEEPNQQSWTRPDGTSKLNSGGVRIWFSTTGFSPILLIVLLH